MKIPTSGQGIVFPEPQNKVERVETPQIPQEIEQNVEEKPQENETNRMTKEELLLRIRILRRNITDLGDQVKRKRILLVDEKRLTKEMSTLSAMNVLDQLNMELQYLENLAINYFNIKRDDIREMENKSLEIWEWDL